MFDTHVHFDGFMGLDEARAVVERAQAADVSGMVAVGGSAVTNAQAAALAADFPGLVWPAPGYGRDQNPSTLNLASLEQLLDQQPAVALGETGLDYHHDHLSRDSQLLVFKSMLDLALRRTLPIIVHCRLAEKDVTPLLEAHARAWTGPAARLGVLHCFTGDAFFADTLLGLGYHISFSGILTFKNASPLRAVAARIPRDRLLVETDAPWLAPEPMRGQKNEPAFVRRTVEMLAEIRGEPPDTLAALTAANARRLFLGHAESSLDKNCHG